MSTDNNVFWLSLPVLRRYGLVLGDEREIWTSKRPVLPSFRCGRGRTPQLSRQGPDASLSVASIAEHAFGRAER